MSDRNLPEWPLKDGERLAALPASGALIEASAGTGKTYQTEGLILRLVAEEGLPIESVLVITFTKAATAELRGRVRDRLERGRAALAGELDADKDDVLKHLVADADLRDRRLQRVEAALANYDQAPISTIHSFCQRALAEHSLAAGFDPSPEVQTDASALLERLVDDAMGAVAARANAGACAALAEREWKRETLIQVAKAATAVGAGRLTPAVSEPAKSVAELVDRLVIPMDRQATQAGETLEWLASDEGRRAMAAWEQMTPAGDKSPPAPGSCKVKGLQRDRVPALKAALLDWLNDGAASPIPSTPNLRLWLLGVQDKAGLSDAQFASLHFAPLVRRVRELASFEPWEIPEFAAWIREAMPAARAEVGLLTYDAMIAELAERLRAEDEASAQPLREKLRARYQAALVDEFQDTDAAQWDILRAVFLESPVHKLFVVGDPKQAIYRFRGANLGVYLAAKEAIAAQGGRLASLQTNHRADRPLVEALNGLWVTPGAAAFGAAGVAAEAMKAHHDLRCDGLGAAVALRTIPEPEEQTLADAAARLIQQMLTNSAQHVIFSDPKHPDGRPLRADDLAVLTNTNSQAAMVQAALAAVGVASVRSGTSSIFSAPAALWLRAYLEAVEDPDREGPSRLLALSPLVGWSVDRLDAALKPRTDEGATADDIAAPAAWEALRARVRAAHTTWPQWGVSRSFDKLADAQGLRLRMRAEGDASALADLRQLLERLHREERRARLGVSALKAWLIDQINDADDNDEQQQREIDSGESAVTLSTVHASKGLQYGVVLLPFFARKHTGRNVYRPVTHSPDDATQGERVLSLHPKGSTEQGAASEREKIEQEQEKLRQLYVATTRARHKLIVWIGLTAEGGVANPTLQPVFADPVRAQAPSDAHRSVEPEPVLTPPTTTDPEPAETVVVRPWQGLDGWNAWRVTSYSGMSAGRGVELDERRKPDDAAPEATASAEPPDTTDALRPPERPTEAERALAPGAAFFGGTKTGDLLHAIFEHLNFEAQPPRAKDGAPLAELITAQGARFGFTRPKAAPQLALAEALVPGWLDTPLRFPGGEVRLRQLTAADRGDELAFDLRLGAGLERVRRGGVKPAAAREALDAAVTDKTCKAARWLQPLLASLDAKAAAEAAKKGEEPKVVGLIPAIQGILNGSIDLAFQAKANDGTPRYFVADYKSNQLKGSLQSQQITQAWPLPEPAPAGAHPGSLRRWHYSQNNLAWGMAHAGYHLQSLIYTVALHRWLLRRVRGYSYSAHFGGHFYLYLRGMEGGDSDQGVWFDRWPEATVLGLDAALNGADRSTVADLIARVRA